MGTRLNLNTRVNRRPLLPARFSSLLRFVQSAQSKLIARFVDLFILHKYFDHLFARNRVVVLILQQV